MNRKAVIAFGAVVIALSLAMFFAGRGSVRRTVYPEVEYRTDTIVRIDTFIERVPTPVRVTQIRTEYVYITDTLTIHDTLLVGIPIEQKVYEDSLYKAYVSGYMPSLDSINIYSTTRTITNTMTVRKESPRISFGIDAGAGVLFPVNSTPTFGFYVGAGLHYRIPIRKKQ